MLELTAPPPRRSEAIDAPAVLLTAPHRLEPGSVRVPRPGAGEALVRVRTVGVCASDLALHGGRSAIPHTLPLCLGHEWSGVVEAVGSETARVRPGDLVTGEPNWWCGRCDRCRRDPNLCRDARKFGFTIDGAARSHVCLHERHLHIAPTSTPDLVALAEPLAVCAHGIDKAAAAHDEPLAAARALVIGAGMLGLGCLLTLQRRWGCSDVTIVDLSAARRERAAELGGDVLRTLDARPTGNGYAALHRDAGYDLVIETTGTPAALEQAIGLLRPSGTILVLGMQRGVMVAPELITFKAARIIGSIGGSGGFGAALALIREHAYDLKRLITHRFPIADAERAFAIAADRDQALRVQLDVDW